MSGVCADILNRSRKLLGPDHPWTLGRGLNLALDSMALGQIDLGERLHHEVLDGYRTVLEHSHPATLAANARARANFDLDPLFL